MPSFEVNVKPHQIFKHDDYVFEFNLKSRKIKVIGQLSCNVNQRQADIIVAGMAMGACLRDITRKHKTKCGYPVRNLTITIDSAGKIEYTGEFFCYEEIWLLRKWNADGIDLGSKEPTEMDLEYASE